MGGWMDDGGWNQLMNGKVNVWTEQEVKRGQDE